MKRFIIGVLTALGILTALAMPLSTASAQVGLPLLAGQWMQWALSIPANDNPLLDTSGEFCMVGQSGPIWFLAGIFGSGNVTRSCSVPGGSTLFFPVINVFNFNTPDCGQNGENYTFKYLQGLVTPAVDGVFNLSATLDGSPIPYERIKSQPFFVAMPNDNVFEADACGTGVPLPSGIYSPGFVDGYWVVVRNLKARPAPYIVHFHGEFADGNIQDVTYNLTVVPLSLK